MSKSDVKASILGVAVLGVVTFVVALLISVPLIFLWAWALRILWGWFIVTTFPAVPMLSYAQAMGVSVTVSILKGAVHEAKEKEESWKYLLGVLLKPIMAVGVGWAVKYFGGM